MTLKDIKVDQIITYLISVWAVSALVSNRIYWGEPNKEQTANYITIAIASEANWEMNRWTLLEFRFIAWDKEVKFATLMAIRNAVSAAMLWIRTMWTFNPYSVVEESKRDWYDTKDRKVILQDYRFYFAN